MKDLELTSPVSLEGSRLSAWETLGQSLASVAPTASPAMVVPLVLASSGKVSWLAYVLATVGIICIASQINRFAVRSASPGSLYSFVHESLGRWPSLITGWALIIAYIGTAAAVTGGFTSYAFALAGSTSTPSPLIASALTAVALLFAGFLAYRDVQLSARVMLWLEVFSIALILFLFFYPGERSALHLDTRQLRISLADLRGVRAGLVLAIFSFVGFESAATLGAESVDPKRTIPRAIRFTAIVGGLFFILTAYAEYVAFGSSLSSLQNSSAPLELLAHLRGLSRLGFFLSVGSAVSFFACTLACITAGARMIFAMGRDGYLHLSLARTHAKNRTPHIAVLAVVLGIALPTLALTVRGVAPFDLYGWIGTIATFGFITAYFVVTAAAFVRSVRERNLTLWALISSAGSLVVLCLAAWSSFDTSAPAPLRWLPYLYLGLLVLGIGLSALHAAQSDASEAECGCDHCHP